MRILILIFLSMLFSGCGDGSKLSRGKAEDLIEKHEGFQTITADIPDDSPRFVWNGDAPMGNELLEVIISMAKEGLVRYAMQPGWITRFKIELTDSGKKHVLGAEKAKDGTATWYMVKLCERKVAEVSGIEQPGQQEAVVHFTYTIKNPTPFGKLAPKVCSGEVREGSAVMTLFDDGWRVRSVSTSESRLGGW